jgi:hypothetical protein
MSTTDLFVITSSDQLLFLYQNIFLFFTKQGILKFHEVYGTGKHCCPEKIKFITEDLL